MILAQVDPFADLFKQLGTAFRAQGSTWPAALQGLRILLIVLVFAVPLFFLLRNLIRRFDPNSGPYNLFLIALRTCRVSFLDRSLLAWIVRRQRTPHPTAMLLAQPLYQDVVEKGIQSMRRPLRVWAKNRLDTVEQQMFGG